ncbi:MAG: hypothetical protein EPO24_02390 [Bacteroidetes bacterium]|nr:MAG: hypothetical protein EPO24_02390 [Bacteroidota bacterium]
MPEDNRLIELVSEMLVELKQIKTGQQETNTRLNKLEEQQARTNALLMQHGRDILRIVELLDERVVHWGDNVKINGENGIAGVVSKIS